MHYLLERQLKKVFNGTFQLSPELEAFLNVVSGTYDNYDKDRKFLDRSFAISSKEFLELNNKVVKLLEEIKIEKESVEQKVIERTRELRQKAEELDRANQLLTKREHELTLTNERLLELDKVKTEFISVAAHQLRTPLAAIKWTLALLVDEHSDTLTAKQSSYLVKAYESNERMLRLINDMLVVTRIESGKMQYSFSSIHIEDLVDSVLVDFSGQARARDIILTFERPETALPYVTADPEKIHLVLQNLIENALYYTKDKGAISLFAKREGDLIKVLVKDNGIGIPPHQQSSIFNKFFRADNALKVKTDGSGLGLFVAKSIVDAHRGEIGFESTEGVGSTFYFTIPCSGRTEVATSGHAV